MRKAAPGGSGVVRSDECGKDFEKLVAYVLRQGGYHVVEQQRKFGRRHGLSDYVLDVLATPPRRPGEPQKKFAVSCKWQRVPGTWDEKVPAEAKTLAEILRLKNGPGGPADLPLDDRPIYAGYVVLGGPGFSEAKKERWCGSGWTNTWKPGVHCDGPVRVINLDLFVAMAYKAAL